MRLRTYCLLALLWPVVSCYSQNSAGSIRPLNIGDTLPADLELTNIYNYPVSKIRFSDLKGKAIIVDFWGSYCSSCILALANLDSIQKKHSELLQVITFTNFKRQDELVKALSRYKFTRNLQLPISTSRDFFAQYFPHLLVSHIIWINKHGIVKAITGSEYITEANINSLLTNEEISWPVKRDVLRIDDTKPIFGLAQEGIEQPDFIYYSTFTGHLDGIGLPNGTHIDSAQKIITTTFYNTTLLALSQIALDYRTTADRNQFILQVKDTSRYIMGADEYYSEWAKQNTYCYSLQLPAGISNNKVEVIVKEDILRWLKRLGIQVKKEIRHSGKKQTEMYVITEIK